MPRKDKKQNATNTIVKQFVTVAFAEDMELAKQYQELLETNGIDAKIKRQQEMTESGFSDIAILVHEESLDEAHSLISERANYEDFFEMVLDDQDYEQIDSSAFENDEDDDLY
jgi:hypothetical protein